ncbi:iron-responsive transcriptional regulator [Bartonella henselae]|uniref:Iron-responsive transcriptional regulator n=1 Tax=Bartonella henselae TaxID=38323 RepID=X5MF47_BARHN|nr:iron-responsive transcriptional regulator RirA [Bartonella henselae]KEC56696.1 protein aau3 [Bartonella henselae str. Zeus]KEC61521.1 protein aau3 [Bartonella henselae JK 53]MDM9996282.1 iron-responsive transcriptional regulator RirA [Bartonella henselae]OLL48366.1 iron-responsive transcriptional regulator [Bartonella henselae]OLL48694.1 iron-responsive transcriptional regulator [Bartonella henselae]
MRLTKQTNYALRILMYCADNQETLSRIPEIAKAYAVSELFLFKILQPLVEAGFVKTVRGRNGGVKLAKPAAEISVADVVKVTEDNFSMAECFDNAKSNCPLIDFCSLNTALQKALNAFFDVLSVISLADLQRPSFRNQLKIDNREIINSNHVKGN